MPHQPVPDGSGPERRVPDRLFAVRHGESTANARFAAAGDRAEVVLPGRDADIPLSGRGVRQAAALGRWLAALEPGERPDLVVCSPYARARQTWDVAAREAAAYGCPSPAARVDERLHDRRMGVLELHNPVAIRVRAPEEARRRERLGEWAWRPPGGETLADVVARVRAVLDDLVADTTAGRATRIMVVAHDATVVALREVISGRRAIDPVPNASVTRWIADGTGLRLVEFAGTAHLTDGGSGTR
jgi:broad specificity phosphatase PhoE